MKVTKAGRQKIDSWIQAHRPDGLAKLARASKIPSGSLQKVRQGRKLVKVEARQRLARAIEIQETELFSEGNSEKSRAS